MNSTGNTQKSQINSAKQPVAKNKSSRKVPNRIREVVYETALDMFECGVMTQTTMREFEARYLNRTPAYTPTQIKKIRQKCNASQGVLAAYMNVSVSALQKWETGARKPDSSAMKLLQLIDVKGLKALVV